MVALMDSSLKNKMRERDILFDIDSFLIFLILMVSICFIVLWQIKRVLTQQIVISNVQLRGGGVF